MARRGYKTSELPVSIKIALSDSLLVLINNYVKELRFAKKKKKKEGKKVKFKNLNPQY